jgi:hypothetical protein
MCCCDKFKSLILKHGKIGTKLGQKCDQAFFSNLQSWNLGKEFDVHDLLTFAIFHRYNLFFIYIVLLMFEP